MNVRDGTVDPALISRIAVHVEDPSPGQVIEIGRIRGVGEGEGAPVPFFPFVDEYGQYVHGNWPGKVYSQEGFAVRRASELAEMGDWPGPADWNAYGGWEAGPALEATGFFYPTKYEGKWWLVDPTGKLFWSYGPTGVGFGGRTPVSDREHWFRGLPDRDGPLGRFYGEGRGARDRYYRDKSYETYDFAHANLYRKYGDDYASIVSDLSHRRLRSWGFNTIGNWSSTDICRQRKTPYVVAIHFGGPWLHRIPDAFDPRFRETVRARMERERGGSAGDPWCIGYFVQNELWWGYWDDAQAVALGALGAPPEAAAKRVFVGDLRAKYRTIAALNESWATSHESWESLLESREPPDRERERVA
ncbi:MAG: beta-agarase, partial [Gemmatimonadales bacterium]|nr:beta-agarase [Gemmatimonadales bacterium]NIR01868.1 beta-agarase [Gemmatimonadales bacterium]NIS65768.1 beta-agarase [Gemmatimonadales bacterium]